MSDKQLSEKFIDHVRERLPDPTQTVKFITHATKPLKKSITINTNKTDKDSFLQIANNLGRQLTDPGFHKDGNSFYIDRDDVEIALGNTFLYQCGFFYIQEIAAGLSATQLQLDDDDIVLDMAAAPGGKTSQLANQLLHQDNVGLVVANDVNGKRLGTLAHNMNMMGRYNTLLTRFNGGSFGSNLPNFFDHVLLDAPCSGEGTGYKSDIAMQRRHPAEINKICGTQLQLLISAIKTLKVGGTVLYSTCTLNPFENEGTLARAIEFFGDSVELVDVHFESLESGVKRSTDDRSFDQVDKVARCRPHLQKTGGFFIAKLRKLDDPKSLKIQKEHKLLPRNQFKLKQNKGLQKKVTTWLQTTFGITPDPSRHFFVASKEKVYLCSPRFKDISPLLHAEKVGIPIAKIDRFGYRPTHYLGNILGHLATKHIVHFDDDQMQRYSEGENIQLYEVTLPDIHDNNKYLIIQWNGYGMSIGKLVGEVVKNKFGK